MVRMEFVFDTPLSSVEFQELFRRGLLRFQSGDQLNGFASFFAGFEDYVWRSIQAGNRDSLLVDKGRNEMNLGPVSVKGRIKKALDCRELFVRYKTVATINATAI